MLHRLTQTVNCVRHVHLDKQTLKKLERLAGLRFKKQADIDRLREEIRLANHIFDANTENVEPLYSIVETLIDCPLRDDEPVKVNNNYVFENAAVHSEGFFVSPPANMPPSESDAVRELKE